MTGAGLCPEVEIMKKREIKKCRSCGIRFRIIDKHPCSRELCCSQTCLDRVGPFQTTNTANLRPLTIVPGKGNLPPRSQRPKKPQAPRSNAFYRTDAWLKLRYSALLQFPKVCMACEATKGPFHVDHIKPRSMFPDLALRLDNLQILCAQCNLGKSNWDQTDWRPKVSSVK
jgi:Restriction endonuclease